jgi:hypothetical protein
MIEEIPPCSPSELGAQIAYLASTPVAGIAQLRESGQCRLRKGVVRSLAVLGSLKTECGRLGTIPPPPTSGEQKVRVAQVLPALRQLPDGGDLLSRIEGFLQMNETDIEYHVTVMRLGTDLIVKDGNARTIAFSERRKDTADPPSLPCLPCRDGEGKVPQSLKGCFSKRRSERNVFPAHSD